jgi:hypothetical protein
MLGDRDSMRGRMGREGTAKTFIWGSGIDFELVISLFAS